MWLLGYTLAGSAFAYLMWFAWTTFKPTTSEEPTGSEDELSGD